MIPSEAFQPILDELARRPLEINNYRNTAGSGRSQAFGLVGRRSLPPDYSRHCWKRPQLYKLLLDFGAKYVPFPFTSITVNQNYQAAPHRDKNNKGVSFLVACGEYEGGELEILEGEKKGVYDIRHNPITEDFSKVLHAVRPFTGNRVSLVFYTYITTIELPPPSIRDGLFYRGEECIRDGLPHPLKGRKKSSYL